MCFLSGVQVFPVVYALLYAPDLVISYITSSLFLPTILDLYIFYWDFLGRISGSNTVCTYVSYHVFPYVSLIYGEHASCINMRVTTHLA